MGPGDFCPRPWNKAVTKATARPRGQERAPAPAAGLGSAPFSREQTADPKSLEELKSRLEQSRLRPPLREPPRRRVCAIPVPKVRASLLPKQSFGHFALPGALAPGKVTVKCYGCAGKTLLRRQKNDPLSLPAGPGFPSLQTKGICAGKHAQTPGCSEGVTSLLPEPPWTWLGSPDPQTRRLCGRSGWQRGDACPEPFLLAGHGTHGPFTWISPRGSADDQGGPWPKSPSLCRAQTAAPRRDGSSSFGARLVSASSRLLGRLRRCSRSSAPPGAGPAPAGSGVPKSGQGSVRNRRRRGLPPRCSAPGSPHRPPAGSS